MADRTRMSLFSSLRNFRDVGGCPTTDGRRVRTARLYRSDTLAKISDEDLRVFADLGVRTVVDLQRPSEIAQRGRIADAPGRRYVNIPPEHAPWGTHAYDETDGPVRFLADRYRDLARDGHAGFGTALGILADESAGPVVVHCYAGKDRTGVLIALTLGLLGVADDEIADDYARSDAWTRTSAPADLPKHWTVAPREAMVEFLAVLRDDYGSVERYATGASVTPEQIAALRSHLLA